MLMKKVALITGASSGIGRELAIIHAQKGGDIVAVAKEREGLEKVKLELESKYRVTVYLICKDLAQQNAAKEIYEEIKAKKIIVDYLINNAGFGGVGKFHERPLSIDLTMIKVNVIAVVALSRYFLPDFIARNSGRILNTSSTVSLIPGPGQAVYFASKAFITSFSHSLYGELNGKNVSVTTLLPGPTKTAFGNSSGMNKTAIYKKPAKASTVAQAGYSAMMKGKLQVIAGLSLWERIQLKLFPFIPSKILIEQVRKKQEV